MLQRLIMLAVSILGLALAQSVSAASAQAPVSSLSTIRVIEYYHAGLDHYFITADAAEVEALDGGTLTGWSRTGYEFAAYAAASSGATLRPVCRFYGRPEAGLDSHFYSGSSEECAAVASKFAASWQLESGNVFQVEMPDAVTGACSAQSTPVYRVFNQRSDVNHRYTTDASVQQEMIKQKYVAEGYGPDAVAFCSPASLSATISAFQFAPDGFNFGTTPVTSAGATIVAYAWDFGDGTTAAGATASHKFATAATYPVVLTITDSTGVVATASKIVTASKLPPSSGGIPTTTSIFVSELPPDGFSFSAASKMASGVSIASYAWNFGDGTTAMGTTATHAYADPGTYQIVLTATDSKGVVVTSSTSVTASVASTATPPSVMSPPAANIVATQTAADTFDYSADASSPSGLAIVSYAWDFGDGSTGLGSALTHSYAADGNYVAVLTLTDSAGGVATATKNVTVSASVAAQTHKPATASIVVQPTATNTYNFIANAAASTGAKLVSYAWNYGDGKTGAGLVVSHVYTAAGSYTVLLTVTDSVGETAKGSAKVKAVGTTTPPPTTPISVSMVVTATAPDTFDFGSSAVASSGATLSSYVWSFGDGGTAAGATTSHRYTTSGTFPVVLTVKDSKGATATANKSVTATVTTPGTPPPPPPPTTTPPAGTSDFDARKGGAGVVRWFDFDAASQLGGGYGANFGTQAGTSAMPSIDTALKSSGAGSLRFDVPSNSGSNGGGAWWANFSPDLQTQFGENSEFYVQWRQRFNQAFIDTYFTEAGGPQGGIKQMILTAGDQVGGKLYASCEAIGNVMQTYYQNRFPIVYNSCTGSGSHAAYSGMYQTVTSPSFDFQLQNGRPSPYCTYTQAGAKGISNTVNAPTGCFSWVANEWLTFQMAVTLGPRDNVNNDFSNSRVRLWAARDGKPSQLLIDWRPGIGGYFPLAAGPLSENQRFGKIWLLPYMTNKDVSQVHPLVQTWYDELIISKQPIADPVVGTLPPNSTIPPPTTTPPSTTPPVTPPTTTPPPPATAAAIAALADNTALDLGTYKCTDAAGEYAGVCGLVTDYSGMVYDKNRQRMVVFGGGHSSTSYDGLNTFDLSALKWVEDYPSGPCSSHSLSNYDKVNGAWITGSGSGPYPRPAARHTTDQLVIVGDELILPVTVEGNGNYCNNIAGYTGYELATNAKIAHYNFVTKTWLFTNANATVAEWPGAALDPKSNTVVLLSQVGLDIYDPVAKTKTRAIDLGAVNPIKDEQGNKLANSLRYNNNLVYFPPTQKMYYFESAGRAVFEIDLNNGNPSQSKITRLTTTGTPPPATEVGYAFDSVNNIIGGAIVQNTFYAFDPVTKAWNSSVIQGGSPGTLAFHAIDYDPVNRIFVFITDQGSGRKTWAYRYKK